MKHSKLIGFSVSQLASLFAAIGVEEDKAEKADDVVKRNRLAEEMHAVQAELKGRPGDQRRALLPLYNHRNMQVRLMAAEYTLAVAPMEARQLIEAIAASNHFPQAGDAGMCLSMLDQGKFVPE
jgi:hypothetical protein